MNKPQRERRIQFVIAQFDRLTLVFFLDLCLAHRSLLLLSYQDHFTVTGRSGRCDAPICRTAMCKFAASFDGLPMSETGYLVLPAGNHFRSYLRFRHSGADFCYPLTTRCQQSSGTGKNDKERHRQRRQRQSYPPQFRQAPHYLSCDLQIDLSRLH